MNTQTQHTPGPWTVSPVIRPDLDDDPMGQYNVQPANKKLSERYWSAPPESDELQRVHNENAANARLIAAAPELLEALQQVQKIIPAARQYFPKSIQVTDRFALELACAAIDKAIAKATGETK